MNTEQAVQDIRRAASRAHALEGDAWRGWWDGGLKASDYDTAVAHTSTIADYVLGRFVSRLDEMPATELPDEARQTVDLVSALTGILLSAEKLDGAETSTHGAALIAILDAADCALTTLRTADAPEEREQTDAAAEVSE